MNVEGSIPSELRLIVFPAHTEQRMCVEEDPGPWGFPSPRTDGGNVLRAAQSVGWKVRKVLVWFLAEISWFVHCSVAFTVSQL